MDEKVKDNFGYTFKRENINDIDALIRKSITEFVDKDLEIKNFLNNNFYNYGSTTKNFDDLIDKGL
jgi:hypothetical protein